jgi:SAM-dependent methyltransferase
MRRSWTQERAVPDGQEAAGARAASWKAYAKGNPVLSFLHARVRDARSYLRFLRDYRRFRVLSQAAGNRFPVSWSDRHPCLRDRTRETGFDRHYVFHPAWAARVLAETAPPVHVDISSTPYFCALVSAFIPIRFYEYRPADLALDNLTAGTADLLSLPFADGSVPSLSCMHVLEHIGLGRYGDPLDPEGDRKAIGELKRVLAPGGSLLLVVPVGRPRVVFNAHRVYAFAQIRDAFAELHLEEFALVPDDPADGGLIRNATEAAADAQECGCGCFRFVGRNG